MKMMVKMLNKEKIITLKTEWKTWKNKNNSWRRNWWKMKNNIFKKLKSWKKIIGKRNNIWVRKIKDIWMNFRENTSRNWKRWRKNCNWNCVYKFMNWKREKTCTSINLWKIMNKPSTNWKIITTKSPETI